jgi:hypothetical protein
LSLAVYVAQAAALRARAQGGNEKRVLLLFSGTMPRLRRDGRARTASW